MLFIVTNFRFSYIALCAVISKIPNSSMNARFTMFIVIVYKYVTAECVNMLLDPELQLNGARSWRN